LQSSLPKLKQIDGYVLRPGINLHVAPANVKPITKKEIPAQAKAIIEDVLNK
jgi:hypothetical protein